MDRLEDATDAAQSFSVVCPPRCGNEKVEPKPRASAGGVAGALSSSCRVQKVVLTYYRVIGYMVVCT